jgi:hypothetical protein
VGGVTADRPPDDTPEIVTPEIFTGTDGADATRRALGPERLRTAVWVGVPDEPAIEEFRAEIGRRA